MCCSVRESRVWSCGSLGFEFYGIFFVLYTILRQGLGTMDRRIWQNYWVAHHRLGRQGSWQNVPNETLKPKQIQWKRKAQLRISHANGPEGWRWGGERCERWAVCTVGWLGQYLTRHCPVSGRISRQSDIFFMNLRKNTSRIELLNCTRLFFFNYVYSQKTSKCDELKNVSYFWKI